MRPVPCATRYYASCGARLPRRALDLYAVLVACLLVAASCRHDPLQQLDAFFIGAAITNRCNPAFDWNKSGESAAALGRQAYEQLLRDLQATHPNDPSNGFKADDALQGRMQEMVRRGEQMVSEKGCADPEIQELLRKFASGN